eukprot:TRINITY_DN7677_c0_g1_i1.p1 TRINITY_DN7677_c0_g1~~TRINITY_DN7677_c0_g1_i1.p1  ORF type:complete len:138 (-),score=14.10 TRINITY_DN7677_c0_g1_i1:405-818(-)
MNPSAKFEVLSCQAISTQLKAVKKFKKETRVGIIHDRHFKAEPPHLLQTAESKKNSDAINPDSIYYWDLPTTESYLLMFLYISRDTKFRADTITHISTHLHHFAKLYITTVTSQPTDAILLALHKWTTSVHLWRKNN